MQIIDGKKVSAQVKSAGDDYSVPIDLVITD